MALPQLRLRILPKFPARALGVDGIAIDRSGGTYTIRQDWSGIAPAVLPADIAQMQLLVRDTALDEFVTIDGDDFLAPVIPVFIADQPTAEAGVSNTTLMSPLRTKQQIDARVGTGAGDLAAGDDARLSDERVPLDSSVTDAKVATPGTPSAGVSSAKIGFLQTGTGGVYRTVQEDLRDAVKAGQFWLAIDADDTASIQRAVAASTTVYLPAAWRPSGYVVSSSISIPLSGTSIFGDRRATRINVTDHDFDVFVCTAVGQVDIFDLCVQNFGTQGASAAWVIRADSTYHVHVNNVMCLSMTCGVKLGDDGNDAGGSRSAVHQCQFLSLSPSLGIGILCEGGAELREFSYIQCSGGLRGVQIRGGVSYSFKVVQCSLNSTALEIEPTTGRNVAHVRLDEFWADTSGGTGIILNGINGGIIDVSAVNSWASTNGTHGVSLSGTVKDFSWNSGRLYDNASDGINVAGGSDTRGLMLNDNQIGGNVGAGVSIDNNAGFYTIANNNIGTASVFGANGFGIYAATGAQAEQVIVGNNLKGNTGGNTLIKGTDSIIEDNIGIKFSASGSASGTTDGSGDLVVTHGLAATPTNARVTLFGGGATTLFAGHITAVTSTTFTVRCFNNGAAVVSGAVSLYWEAAA